MWHRPASVSSSVEPHVTAATIAAMKKLLLLVVIVALATIATKKLRSA
jgi:hypothetical protein